MGAEDQPVPNEIMPTPYKKVWGDEKAGVQVDTDFNKDTFNAEHPQPDFSTFKGEDHSQAVAALEAEATPGLIELPPDMQAKARDLVRQDLVDRQQATARDREEFVGISNAHLTPVSMARNRSLIEAQAVTDQRSEQVELGPDLATGEQVAAQAADISAQRLQEQPHTELSPQ